ncbi:TPA: hypothetical protein ACG0RQ_006233, partial [Pseudomonas aeruginosa]
EPFFAARSLDKHASDWSNRNEQLCRQNAVKPASLIEVQCVKESDRYRQAGQTTLQRSPPDRTGYWC